MGPQLLAGYQVKSKRAECEERPFFSRLGGIWRHSSTSTKCWYMCFWVITITFCLVLPTLSIIFLNPLVIVGKIAYGPFFVDGFLALAIPALIAVVTFRFDTSRFGTATRENCAAVSRQPAMHWYSPLHQVVYECYILAISLMSSGVYLVLLYNYDYSFRQITYLGISYEYYSYELSEYITADNYKEYAKCAMLEYFLVMSLGLDICFQLLMSTDPRKHSKSVYFLMDLILLFFLGYYNYISNLQWSTHYNLYILVGPLRFFRVRRCLTLFENKDLLDKLFHRYVKFDTRHLVIGVMLARLVLFFCSIAAIIQWMEYPCISVAARPEECNDEIYQVFHHCFVYVVGTFGTIGYGDHHPGTAFAKVFIVFSFLLGLALLPGELDRISAAMKKDDEVDGTDQVSRINKNVEALTKKFLKQEPEETYKLWAELTLERKFGEEPEVMRQLCNVLGAKVGFHQQPHLVLVQSLFASLDRDDAVGGGNEEEGKTGSRNSGLKARDGEGSYVPPSTLPSTTFNSSPYTKKDGEQGGTTEKKAAAVISGSISAMKHHGMNPFVALMQVADPNDDEEKDEVDSEGEETDVQGGGSRPNNKLLAIPVSQTTSKTNKESSLFHQPEPTFRTVKSKWANMEK